MTIQSNRKPKDEVNYRLHEQCSTCVHYYSNACEVVEGNISADAVCNDWKLKESSSGHSGEFFVGAYRETSKEESKE